MKINFYHGDTETQGKTGNGLLLLSWRESFEQILFDLHESGAAAAFRTSPHGSHAESVWVNVRWRW
jgi:hypothetical protein